MLGNRSGWVAQRLDMAENIDDIQRLSDDELVDRYRRLKAEGSRDDPRLTPSSRPLDSAVREEWNAVG